MLLRCYRWLITSLLPTSWRWNFSWKSVTTFTGSYVTAFCEEAWTNKSYEKQTSRSRNALPDYGTDGNYNCGIQIGNKNITFEERLETCRCVSRRTEGQKMYKYDVVRHTKLNEIVSYKKLVNNTPELVILHVWERNSRHETRNTSDYRIAAQ